MARLTAIQLRVLERMEGGDRLILDGRGVFRWKGGDRRAVNGRTMLVLIDEHCVDFFNDHTGTDYRITPTGRARWEIGGRELQEKSNAE